MSANAPITNNEREIGDMETLVFRAGLNGAITYADRAFIRVSGFHEGELYGKSHNIVRHPDMPQAIFMDMQETVANGRAWEGIVKNRCRNGDFYWARATVSPVRAGSKITGYKSVYCKPTQSQIGEACRLYQQINEGKEAVLCLSSLADLPGRRYFPSSTVFKPHFAFILTFLSLLLVCAGAAGLYESAHHHPGMRYISIGFLAAGLLAAAWLGFQLIRAVTRSRKKIIRPVAAMAPGEMDSKAAISKDEAECLRQPLDGMSRSHAGLAASAGDGQQQLEKQAAEPWKTSSGMKEQRLAVRQNAESARPVRQVARSSSDISIKRDKRPMASTADDEAGRTVEGIVVAVKRVANIMAEISVVPAAQDTASRCSGRTMGVAGNHEIATQPKKAIAKGRPLRTIKDEDDEWKDF